MGAREGTTVMDCGARRQEEDFVIRIRGSEYLVSQDEYDEFFRCIRDCEMSPDYLSIPRHEPPAPKGEGKISLANLFGPRQPRIATRV